MILYLKIAFLTIAATVLNENIVTQKTKNNTTDAVKIGVVGLVHNHVGWILGRENIGDIEIVGIVEPNRAVAQKYAKQYGYSMDIVYDDIASMVSATSPQAVTAFNPIYDHLETVRYCAPRGIHVMVEKPMAVSWEHAKEMADLAEKHNIHLLTNFETTWYDSNWEAYQMINDQDKFGEPRKLIFKTGHPGPIEIGCSKDFTDWLTDPKMNGAGALTDFGCYGANLSTWILHGQKPISVSCTVQTLKPNMYPNVDDEATIVISYPTTQVIIQASWNWPFHRKDMEVHCETGFVICENGTEMEILEKMENGSFSKTASPRPTHKSDPFAVLAAVINDNHEFKPFEPTTLENNIMVMQILDAAIKSAESGKVMMWDDLYGN